jgi:pimeloyl-ACP methyl ester carboxylesterase
LLRFGHRALPDGGFTLGYDPAIGEPYKAELNDVDLWPFYDRVACPTLVVRGAKSDLLLADTADEMTRRGPKAELYVVPDTGHAPMLVAEDQIARIERFFASA